MTAATITTGPFNELLHEEKVELTVTDGETYTTDMSSPKFVQITSSEDMGSETNSASYSISGKVITIYADGVTDKKMALTISGYL